MVNFLAALMILNDLIPKKYLFFLGIMILGFFVLALIIDYPMQTLLILFFVGLVLYVVIQQNKEATKKESSQISTPTTPSETSSQTPPNPRQ